MRDALRHRSRDAAPRKLVPSIGESSRAERRRAVRFAWILGMAIAAALFAWRMGPARSTLGTGDPQIGLTAAGLVVAMVGARWLIADASARSALRRPWVPVLPADAVEEGETAWLTGEIDCPQPYLDAVSGDRCAWARVVARTAAGAQFAVVTDGRFVARTWLVQGDRRIELDLGSAELLGVPEWSSDSEVGRSTLTRFPASGRVLAWGSVRRESRPPPPEPGLLALDAVRETACGGTRVERTVDVPAAEAEEPAAGTGPATAAGSPVLTGSDGHPALVSRVSYDELRYRAATEGVRSRTTASIVLVAGTAICLDGWGRLISLWDDFPASTLGGLLLAMTILVPFIAWTSIRRIDALRSRAEAAAPDPTASRPPSGRGSDSPRALVAAGLAEYDKFADDHNETIATAPFSWFARAFGRRPLPLSFLARAGDDWAQAKARDGGGPDSGS